MEIKHEVGRQLALWRSVGHLDSLRDQNQSCCSTSRRSRKSTTDPLNVELRRKQARCQLARARANRYTSSSDQLRAALLKLQPASRRGEHGKRHTPPCPVWRCEIVTCTSSVRAVYRARVLLAPPRAGGTRAEVNRRQNSSVHASASPSVAPRGLPAASTLAS